MTTDCVLASAKQLRLIITTLCFGGVLLWILSGQYLDRDESLGYVGPAEDGPAELRWQTREWSGRTQLPRSHLRRLMETTEDGLEGSHLHNHSGTLSSGSGDLDHSGTLSSGSGDFDNNTATAQCTDVHKLSGNESKCTFIKTVDNCQNDDGLLNYLNFIYCTMPGNLIPLALVLLFFWLLFLFIFLGATAEEYFCPSLTVMSHILHLSQNVAGVTLLALGNGAPDIFSSFAAISQEDDHKSSLAIGALFGAGMFVTTVVVGAVALLTPFQLTKRPFLRDILFYTVAVYWTFSLLWRNTVDIYNAAGFIAFYVVYVVVVIVGRAVYHRWKKRKSNGKPQQQSDIARKPRSPTGVELISLAPIQNGGPPSIMNGVLPGLMNGTLSIATPGGVTKTPVRASSSQFRSSNPPIPEEEDEEDEKEEGEQLHHVVHLGDGISDSEPQTQPGAMIQITTSNESEQEAVVPGLHTPPVKPSPTQQQASREELFSGGFANPLFPQIGAALLSPGVDARKGRSVSPSPDMERAQGYAQRRVVRDEVERPHNASPRKLLRKTLSGALDITEEVGAAVGIPHVPQIWEEVHKVHHRRISRSPTPDTSHESENEEGGEQEEENRTTSLHHKPPKRPHPFLVLLRALWPFGEDFKQLGKVGKIYEIVKYPCSLILTLTVPVIDHEADLHNWNRWLNILHCVTGPMAIAVFTKHGFYLIGGVFPIWTLVLVLSTLVAIVVACTSRNDKKPVYHCVFAWVGFAVSVVWIYCIANEIVNLVHAFAIVIKLSDGILGLTLLAWGNSIGDAVSNLTMARQGFPRMALGACFGGPLLNMLIGIGVASVYKSIKRRADGFKFTLYFTQVELFAAIFLIVGLALSLTVITLFRFRLRRPYGVFLIVFYVVFLVVAIVAESQVFTITISDILSKK